jgi:hypothetical protein
MSETDETVGKARDLLEMTVDYLTDSRYARLRMKDAPEGVVLESWLEIKAPDLGHFRIEFELDYNEYRSSYDLADLVVWWRVIECKKKRE